jgi:hypothetical protein
MTTVEARITLAMLVEWLFSDRGLEYEEFLKDAPSFTRSGLQRYLRGYVRLHPNQLIDVLEVFEPHEALERHMLVLCIAQFYGGHVVELFERHLRSEDCESRLSIGALLMQSQGLKQSHVLGAINEVSRQSQDDYDE